MRQFSGMGGGGSGGSVVLSDPSGSYIPIGAAGTEYSGILDAHTAAASVTGASYVWTDSVGCKAFAISRTLVAEPVDAPLAVAWSTTEDDEAGIQAILAALITEYALTAGNHTGLFVSNVKILTVNDPYAVQFYDGTTTIKTIGAAVLSGSATEYRLELVV